VVLANTQKAPMKSRKLIEVGLTNLLTKSDAILESGNQQLWPQVFVALLDLFTLPQDITYAGAPEDDIGSLDPEAGGFQSSFSKLGASEGRVSDPSSRIADERLYASQELTRRGAERPGVLPALVQQAQGIEADTVAKWLAYMSANGGTIQ